MISCPNLLRGRYVPLAILAAIVALIATSVAWNHDEGSELETIGDASAPEITGAEDDIVARSADIPAPVDALDLIETSPTLPGGAAAGLPADEQAAATATTTADGAAAQPGASDGAAGAPGAPGSSAAGTGAGTTGSTAAPTTKPTAPPTTKAPATTKPPATTPPPSGNCTNPWGNLEGCGWPGAGNTGARTANCPNGFTYAGNSVTGSTSITTPNTVISCQRISGNLVIQAANVTVRDTIVTFDGGGGTGGGAIVVNDGGSATIEHVEVDGMDHTHTCVWHQGVSVVIDALNCHGTDDGVFAFARLAYSATSGDNFTIKNSYFHGFTHNAANGHIDGFQTEGTSNGVISHNTFLMKDTANAAIAIWDGEKNATNIQITGNLFAGAEWVVFANDYHPSQASPGGGNSVTNISFTNNVFSTYVHGCVGKWGVWYTTNNSYAGGPTDGWHRSGNKVLETGASLDNGDVCR